jgi:hypothetical protein
LKRCRGKPYVVRWFIPRQDLPLGFLRPGEMIAKLVGQPVTGIAQQLRIIGQLDSLPGLANVHSLRQVGR